MLNLSDSATAYSLALYFLKVYTSTHKIIYQVEMMSQGDKAVENGIRTSMSPSIFLAEAARY
jgi:acyl-CoA thioesterase